MDASPIESHRNINLPAQEQPAFSYRPSISLVLPAYNEQATIAQAVGEAVAALSSLTNDFEVLVVDDGSTDATSQIVAEAMQCSPQVRLLRQPQNMGYGAALRRGFAEATKDLVGFTDADCQFELKELDRLVMLARDYDIVTGYRIDRQDAWLRKLYSAGYNVLVRNLLGTRVRDCDCALKLFHRHILQQLPITTDGFLINGEMLARARQLDFSIVEVGVSHRPRAGGESKVSVAHIPVVLAGLMRYWWNSVMFPAEHRQLENPANQWSLPKQVGMSLVLLFIGASLLLWRLNYALIEPDEARYAQIALEMVDSGDWLTPRLNGEPYLDKPPLLYWSAAACFEAFGLEESSARLPCAVAALLTLLCTYWLGRRLVGDVAAWSGALLLSLSCGFVLAGRFVIMDSPLTLFTTIGLLAALCALQRPRNAWLWWSVVGGACGLGILTKGPIAPVICLPPVLALAWLKKNRGPFRLQNVLAVLVPTLVIAVPWFWLIAEAQSEFVGHFFWKHHVQRFFHAFNHAQPWWFYIPVLAVGMLPASLLVPCLTVYLGQKSEAMCRRRTWELGALLLSGCWVVGFFSLSSCKLPTYVLPAMPMFTLGLGKMLRDVELPRLTPPRRKLHLLAYYACRALRQTEAISAMSGLSCLIAWVVFDPRSWWLALSALALVIVIWKTYRQIWTANLIRHAMGTATVCLAVTFFGFCYVVPEFADWRSVSLSAEKLNKQLGGSAPVVFFGRPGQAAKLAIEGDITELSVVQTADFVDLLDAHHEAVVVATGADLELLKESCGPAAEFTGPAARKWVYVATRIDSVAKAADHDSATR